MFINVQSHEHVVHELVELVVIMKIHMQEPCLVPLVVPLICLSIHWLLTSIEFS